MKKIVVLIVALAFLHTSNAQKNTLEPSQMEEVMASHDKVMSKMLDLTKLVGKLQPKVDKDDKYDKYAIAIKDLKAANKSMVAWMENFGHRFDAEEMMKGKKLTKEKRKWLEEEEVKLEVLQELINSSITKAEKLLGNR